MTERLLVLLEKDAVRSRVVVSLRPKLNASPSKFPEDRNADEC